MDIFIQEFKIIFIHKIGYLCTKNTHDILGITCPKNENPFHLAFLIIELHHYLWTGRLFLLWFSEAVKKLTIELPSKAQM
ncbi:conserved protein [Methanosarcina mazei Go1]|uniref:Conserved protein n=1 Tax=Methanosarcina mazei (strain ATCC BAA-159 / DSM 3647 / Goe1 / Go1 / JCM 11833 / OCM 88) TaxID=192952 RepID=Q8PZH2_METMA|nr:conserved protein [Methanosarcina mazei Go1]